MVGEEEVQVQEVVMLVRQEMLLQACWFAIFTMIAGQKTFAGLLDNLALYLPRDYYTGEPRGFGFVQYVEPADAGEAKYQIDGQMFQGRQLTVVVAEENRKKPMEMRAREQGTRTRHYDHRLSPSHYSRSAQYLNLHHVAMEDLVLAAVTIIPLHKRGGSTLDLSRLKREGTIARGRTRVTLYGEVPHHLRIRGAIVGVLGGSVHPLTMALAIEVVVGVPRMITLQRWFKAGAGAQVVKTTAELQKIPGMLL